MNPTDVRRLYALASSIDQKLALTDIDELALRLEAWSLVLDPVPLTYDQAKQAIAEHYRTNPDTTLMPGHIATRAPRPPQPLAPPTQDAPCATCGLQPANRRHNEHHEYEPGHTYGNPLTSAHDHAATPVIPQLPPGPNTLGGSYR